MDKEPDTDNTQETLLLTDPSGPQAFGIRKEEVGSVLDESSLHLLLVVFLEDEERRLRYAPGHDESFLLPGGGILLICIRRAGRKDEMMTPRGYYLLISFKKDSEVPSIRD